MRIKAAVVLTALLVGGSVMASRPAAAESSVERRLRLLEEQLGKAQAEIKQLHKELDQQRAINSAAQKQTEQVVQQQEAQAKTIETAKKTFELPDWVKRTTLFGDLRLRHEGFYHQPHKVGSAADTARNRERLRARLGLKVTFSDELSTTIRLASGNPNDPISTNQTLTGDFTQFNVNLDWAYLTFTPGASFGIRPGLFSFTGGKFANPMFRVGEMVFDDDLAPEGASEVVSLLDKPVGPLDQVRLYAEQWTFSEVANNQDGWMVGGQVNPVLHFGTTQVEAGLGQYWWLNSDQIAQALNTNSSLTNTNLVVTVPSGTTTKIVGYQSAFNQTNATVAATFPNVVAARPLKLFGDYVYNWGAVTDDAQGWTAGARLGQTKVKGDWSVYGFYEQLQQEAAISAFTYSDFGKGGTNVEGAVVGAEYQLLNPLTVSVKNHFTNFINRPASTTNPTMMRLQLDAMVKW